MKATATKGIWSVVFGETCPISIGGKKRFESREALESALAIAGYKINGDRTIVPA